MILKGLGIRVDERDVSMHLGFKEELKELFGEWYYGGDGGCEACGDIKFVPCETCYGSCKIYYEGDYEEDDNCEVGEGGFQFPKVSSLQ
ncbi:glutaredoxin family protein, putative [Medicago truncatula]|uniref:Glutaredoxin family protein, putative n=1 Tax=Medicago truncatula TaxID=3880 RepID=A0A072USK1_MEDTR|nr:glutaredoxin family protein, putative [Medicago truncatula]